MPKLYKVAHGSITRAGVTFKRGDGIELTDAEAASAFYAKRVVAAGASVDVGAARIAELEQALVDADARIAELEKALVDADARIAELEQALVDADARIAELEKALASAPPPPPAVGKPKK